MPEALRSFSLKFYVLDVRTLTNFFFFFQPIPLHYVVLKKTGKTLKGWRLSWLLAQVWSPLPCLVVAETLANLYAYNPLMRLFRHFSTLLWENALFPSLPPPPSKSLAHSKSVNEPALLLVRNNKDYPRVGVPFIRQWKMRSFFFYYCCCANLVPLLLLAFWISNDDSSHTKVLFVAS